MTTITCQYTGIEFEGRGKNHPKVSKILDEASKDRFHVGAYAKAKELLSAAKGQTTDIDELMVAVRNAFDAWCNGEARPTVRIVKQWQSGKSYDPDRELNDLDDYAQIRK